MHCPNCHSDDVRRSLRRGLFEGLFLRLVRRAPFRCRSCRSRFIAPARLGPQKGRRGRSLTRYFGLDESVENKVVLGVGIFLLASLATVAVLSIFLAITDSLPG